MSNDVVMRLIMRVDLVLATQLEQIHTPVPPIYSRLPAIYHRLVMHLLSLANSIE
jgi:hypothetical protein